MSRKDYKEIASIIKKYVEQEKRGNITMSNLSLLELVATDLTIWLKTDNPRFSREKFLNACGF